MKKSLSVRVLNFLEPVSPPGCLMGVSNLLYPAQNLEPSPPALPLLVDGSPVLRGSGHNPTSSLTPLFPSHFTSALSANPVAHSFKMFQIFLLLTSLPSCLSVQSHHQLHPAFAHSHLSALPAVLLDCYCLGSTQQPAGSC